MKKKHVTFISILFIIIAMVMLPGCSNQEAVSQTEEVTETPVAVAEVISGSLSGNNRITGTTKASSNVAVIPQAAGRISELLVSKGEKVEKGQVLARLENKDQTLALQADLQALSQAENGLTRAQSGLQQAKNNFEQAKANLNQAQSGKNEALSGHQTQLENLQLELQNVERQLSTAERQLERMQALHRDGIISQQQLEEAENGYKAAKEGLDRLRLQISQEEKAFSIDRAQSSIEQAEINLLSATVGIRDAEIAIRDAEIAVEQRRIAVEVSQKRVDDTVITSPVSGQISELDFEVGELVSSQSMFARIIATQSIDIELSVSPLQLNMFEINDLVEVNVAGIEENIQGRVTFIAPAGDASGLFKVEVRVDNADGQLRPGMVVTINIEEELVAESIIVPTAAVIERQGVAYIYLVNDGQAVQKEVEVIRYDTDYTALIGDLSEGDKVVVKGQNLLSDGDLVRVVKEEK